MNACICMVTVCNRRSNFMICFTSTKDFNEPAEVNAVLILPYHEKEEEKKTAKSRNADMHIPACVYCSTRPFDTDTVYPVYGK